MAIGYRPSEPQHESYARMQQTEAELKAKIDALPERAKTIDAAETGEPDLHTPAAIECREARLKVNAETRERLEQRQREADIERGRSAAEAPAKRSGLSQQFATSASGRHARAVSATHQPRGLGK